MATQQAMFSETIAGMKKALKRKSYDSDSDSSIEEMTNRGNKLKKRSRFVHEHQLAAPTGPQAYKKTVEHGGYYRETISRNPPLIDEDGFEVDSDDDDERAQAAIAAAAEFNPYAGIKIEELLMPLVAASDLPHHPTLSKPFFSKTLSELTEHAGDMVHKEKASLWRIKHLFTRLSGDHTWIPCGSLETEDDYRFFLDERDDPRRRVLEKRLSKDDADQASTGTLVSYDPDQPVEILDAVTRATDAALDSLKDVAQETNGTENANNKPIHDMGIGNNANGIKLDEPQENSNGLIDREMTDTAMNLEGVADTANENEEGDTTLVDMEIEGGEPEDVPAPRRMRTRAQAQAASENATSSRTRSESPDFDNENFIHPYFLAPNKSRPDRDVGLPQNEAEETRRMLQLYIQKQEEVCRGAQKLYEGLLRADRYRKLVMKWAKAEAHVGVNRDMSDGEDWYDKEEWGLDEDLKKGQDEEEEDAATTAKKTRTRRQ
ncbi:hypothetical protein HYFRA_00002851 [Hymenoscyphus fraxineus]|uniref:Transcriptional regulatory protein RXT2 N-terminal domain-containing protein n=1 Tax=Hymenoscyphus fraxineus TaxID=746836 RepID=A0A9N9KRC5_9HELO|nr:hypothetical protein HYFRA_00002851 [Hymenoscyphus fraxineus]